jgi:NAD(P)-dependent dehydrogenase (short-subunit alcohol dehydrogenase family)
LVTGAAGGIGRATALSLAGMGATVYGVDLPSDDLVGVGKELGDGHHTEGFDLRQTGRISDLCGRAAAAMGGLDALVHVAGVIIRRDNLDDVTEEDWDIQYEVNLKAAFFLNRESARHMAAGGSIVNFTSQGWWTGGYGGSIAYSATKGGLVSLTRGMARTLAPQGIRVNAIAPGAVDTRMMTDGLSEEIRRDFIQQIPLARMGRPAELASTVTFLLSDAASYITGATLNVSGGQLIY